jgi:gliding motility-associated-like protein
VPNPNCSNKNATISAITPSGSYIYSWTVPSGQSSPGNVSSFTTNIAGTYRLNIKTKTSILCNTDFENNQVISGSNFLITNQNNVPCWKTTASDSMIEVWGNGFSGVPSYSGNQFVELNANMVSTLFQNFIAKSGNQIEISFAHRGRSGTDVMSVEIGKIGGPYINLGNFSAGNTAWVFNSLIYTIPNTISDTNFTLRFNSVSAAGGATIGNFLDAIDIKIISCKSEDTSVQLVINPISTSIINQTICQGNSFLGRTISGTYIDTLVNAKGCDSIRTLNLIVNPKTFGTINQTICEGSSFLFNGFNRAVSGAYLDTLVNAKGCDSILTLNLTVNTKTFGITNQTICQGSSFLFNGINRTISGAYLDTLINAKGCDSILTLNLTVNSKTFSTINQTICEGSSFLGRNTSGTYIDTLIGANAKGCDSIRTLVLTVNPKTFSNFKQTICQGESFFNRTQTGVYHDTFVNAKGCDSIRTLSLIVNPISRTIINKTICEGDVFLGKSSTGIHLDTFKNQFGCDSIREINLVVLSPIRKNLNYAICQGESFRGRTKTSIFIDTIKNGLGCDSIIETVDLYVRPNVDSSFKIKICEGRSYRGKSSAGNYIDSFTNEFGCKSIYRYELSLNPKTYSSETKTICHDQKYKGHTKSGIYKDTLINQYGCDSIITLTLFVKSNFITKKLQDTTIKKGDTALLQAQKGFLYYTWNTKETTSEIMVSDEGKYKVTIMNHDGCIGYDSCNVYIIPRDTIGIDTTIIDSIDGYAECPNVFTPNDDFKNDLFRPNFYGNVEVVRLLVFTRFGEKMYEGHGNFSAWDGIYKGEKCEPGVYVYFIEYNNNKGKHFAKGSVTLVR